MSGVDHPTLRLDVHEVLGAGKPLEGEETWLELDVGSRIVGFDRNGVPTLEAGERVRVQARSCRIAEADWPLVDLVEPEPGP